MVVKIETDAIRIIALFESITKIHAKDCIIEDKCIYFLVDQEKIGLAVGKNGSVIKEVKKVLRKDVRVMGYPDNPEDFIKSQIPSVKSIQVSDGSLILSVPSRERVNVIGKSGRNIKIMKEILKRYFKIKDVKLR